MEDGMRCLTCRNLEVAFEAKRSEYIEAASGAFYRVSKRFAAYVNVEMERAKAELEEHRMVCLSAVMESAYQPAVAPLGLPQQHRIRSGSVQTAA
jgi:hypothetical protein